MSRVSVIGTLAVRIPVMIAQAFSPSRNVRAFREGIRLIARHRRLVVEMARDDLSGRYRGQFLGSAWVLIHPLAMTFVYLFIFGVVFAQRSGRREMPLDYTAYILSGLIPWLTFQLSMVSSVSGITNNAALVKQFIFPLEVLPMRDVAASTVTWFVGVTATLVYMVVRNGAGMWTWLLLPVVLGAQLLAMAGVAFLFSSIAVFFRDLKDVINLLCLVALFLMPVVYLPGWVPAIFQPVIWANPFTYMAWVYQDAIYFGEFQHPVAWLLFAAGAPLVFAWGIRVFRSTKPLFSSVL